MEKIKIYGTIGPSCSDREILGEMIENGMTGIRLNLSHVSLEESGSLLAEWQAASKGKLDLLVDMQGPEMRIAPFKQKLQFEKNDIVDIPMRPEVVPFLKEGQEVLLDDGKYLARVLLSDGKFRFRMLRSGELSGAKSIKIPGVENTLPAITEHDRKNLALAKSSGVTGVMQPFVRGKEDLVSLRKELYSAGGRDIGIFAKIENQRGVEKLEEIMDEADCIVIARGDLGNDIPLWQLPSTQRRIAATCRRRGVPFLVVTQMLQSMEHSPVPTRAEVSDIDHAILDGASAIMATGETAVGEYPSEVISYMKKTSEAALEDLFG